MLQQRNRVMKELERKISDTFWPRARLLNRLALCCKPENKKISKSKSGHQARKDE